MRAQYGAAQEQIKQRLTKAVDKLEASEKHAAEKSVRARERLSTQASARRSRTHAPPFKTSARRSPRGGPQTQPSTHSNEHHRRARCATLYLWSSIP